MRLSSKLALPIGLPGEALCTVPEVAEQAPPLHY